MEGLGLLQQNCQFVRDKAVVCGPRVNGAFMEIMDHFGLGSVGDQSRGIAMEDI